MAKKKISLNRTPATSPVPTQQKVLSSPTFGITFKHERTGSADLSRDHPPKRQRMRTGSSKGELNTEIEEAPWLYDSVFNNCADGFDVGAQEVLRLTQWLSPTVAEKNVVELIVNKTKGLLKLVWEDSPVIVTGAFANDLVLPTDELIQMTVVSPRDLDIVATPEKLVDTLQRLDAFVQLLRKQDYVSDLIDDSSRKPRAFTFRISETYHSVKITINDNIAIMQTMLLDEILVREPDGGLSDSAEAICNISMISRYMLQSRPTSETISSSDMAVLAFSFIQNRFPNGEPIDPDEVFEREDDVFGALFLNFFKYLGSCVLPENDEATIMLSAKALQDPNLFGHIAKDVEDVPWTISFAPFSQTWTSIHSKWMQTMIETSIRGTFRRDQPATVSVLKAIGMEVPLELIERRKAMHELDRSGKLHQMLEKGSANSVQVGPTND